MYWYLIQTKPNAYKIASSNLKLQNFKVFVPLVKKTLKKAKRFTTELMPLFPGYLFLGTPLEKPPWKSINSTRGVSKAVTFDGKYHYLDNDIIYGLKNRCNAKGVFDLSTNIKEGDSATIIDGPLSNFICEIEKIESEQRMGVA